MGFNGNFVGLPSVGQRLLVTDELSQEGDTEGDNVGVNPVETESGETNEE